MSRQEFEYEIPVKDGEDLLLLCQHKLEKNRFVIEHSGHKWEVDQYLGDLQGLWTAEIELVSPNESFELPSWVGQEVTFDGRYSNSSLAKNGIPKGEMEIIQDSLV